METSPVPDRPYSDNTECFVAIVASKYNARYTDAMVKSAQQELEAILTRVEIETVRVPGAYEIPLVVEEFCREFRPKPDAVIALGVILRGKTAHADLIGESVTRCLHDSSKAHLIPVVHEVLLLDNEEQAEERCLGDRINRGIEAARSAVDMIRIMRALRGHDE